MKFAKISPSIKGKKKNKAAMKFASLLCDLGLSNTNIHIGSRLGGDNFLLATLTTCEHHLVAGKTITLSGNVFKWGERLLALETIRDIRGKLDKVSAGLDERYKVQALLLESIIGSNNVLKTITDNQKHFPKLIGMIGGNVKDFDPTLSPAEHLIQAYTICEVLRNDLEARPLTLVSTIAATGKTLSKFDFETFLLSVRRFIGLERIMRHKLDLHPEWIKMIDQVCKRVDC